MFGDLTALGVRFETAGIAAMWLGLLVRAPSAIRSPQQRGLWIAVAAAAVTMTLKLSFFVALAAHDVQNLRLYTLATHLCGVLSAVVVVDFVMITMDRPRREWLHVGSGLAFVWLVVLGLRAAPTMYVHQVFPSTSAAGYAFWLSVIGVHLVSNGVCIAVVCRRQQRHGTSALRTGMRLFGLGSCFAALSWVALLIQLGSGASWVTPVVPFVMGLFCLSRTTVLAVPLLSAGRRVLRDITDFRRLWRLWRDLVYAVPSVALAPPRPLLLELLLPRGPWRLLVYRQVIEIRDAILVLRDYATPEQPCARSGRAAEGEESVARAREMARLLRAACRAKRHGQGPLAGSAALSSLGGHDLVDETAFLVQVADAYAAAPREQPAATVCLR
ncbi:MAB_1171c family putative transporter [Kitasatospora mediocidica]|uniref:MAB_1171c family putative transporter n=1 Tax=Kitasatospora mediocidica TaxID=58352 RepID=UPI00068EF923|nr:MAB_1171c family putative transporter [Kitasatospora mediocidica]